MKWHYRATLPHTSIGPLRITFKNLAFFPSKHSADFFASEGTFCRLLLRFRRFVKETQLFLSQPSASHGRVIALSFTKKERERTREKLDKLNRTLHNMNSLSGGDYTRERRTQHTVTHSQVPGCGAELCNEGSHSKRQSNGRHHWALYARKQEYLRTWIFVADTFQSFVP